MRQYAYDIEIFPNFFSVVFIDLDVPYDYITAYEKADYNKDYELKKKILSYIKPQIFMVYPDMINEIPLLIDFMTNHKTLVGFNSINYDDNILNYLLKNHNRINSRGILSKGNHITRELYDLSQDLITYGSGWKWTNPDYKYFKAPYYSKDMQKLLYLDKKFISLKQVAVQLQHYRLQDLPFHFTKIIESNEIHDVIDYDINDTIITYKLYHDQIEEVNLRESISKLYGVNVRTESRSGTANRLMMSFYAEKTGLDIKDFRDERTIRRTIRYSDIISDKIKFIHPEFSNFLNRLLKQKLVIGLETLKEDVMFNGKAYTVATGGLHSVDKPNIYRETDKYELLDADVTSFYPYIILNEVIYPEHLDGDVYLSILKNIVEERVKAKTAMGKLKHTDKSIDDIDTYISLFKNRADAMKITINAVYGKTGDENSFLYDLKAMYRTTINGQLYLLMLIDMLAVHGIQCISANTDGIVCKVPIDKKEIYYDTCKQWELATDFTLEYANYEKYICHSVNNYIAIMKGYSNSDKTEKDKKKYIKVKGAFVGDIQLDKGYKHPVVPKTLLHYYADGIKPEDYIKNHDNIYDFCISIKTGSDFIKEYHSIKDGQKHIEELPKTVRYYISNSNGVIMKKYVEPKIDKKGIRREYIALHKGYNSTVFNDYFPATMKDYKINYNYYIAEAYKMINEISNIVHLKMKKQSYGGLFKDLEE